MKSINELPVKFYQNLGKLFYAVAAADRVVREQEINRLKEIIHQEWLPLDDAVDEVGNDAAYQMETVFDWLKEHNAESDACLKSFKSFKDKHSVLFTVHVKEKIWKTINSIASAFAGKNKSELIMLNKINHLFDEL